MRRVRSKFIPLVVVGVFIAAMFAFAACSSSGDKASGEQQGSGSQEVAQADEHAGHDHEMSGDESAQGEEMEHTDDMAFANPQEGVDPVCGMKFGDTPVVVQHADKSYAFCSQGCADAFKTDPETYLAAAAKGEYKGR